MKRYILTNPKTRKVCGVEGLSARQVRLLREKGWQVLPA